MMRQITVDYTKPIPCGMKNAGRIGEHNATELIIVPPDFLSANEKVSHYIIAFAVECKVIHSEPIFKANELKISLWSQLTQSEILTVQLEGHDSAGELIGKSEPVRLRFLYSVCGEDVPADTDNHDFMSDYLKNRHSHSNKEVLDNFSRDEGGNPLYNGKAIGGGSGLTDEQAANLVANTEARHTHENKTVLDKFSLDENGEILFDGQPIKAEGVVEGEPVDPKAITAQTVALLLESSETYVSVEAPDVASKETSDFANYMFNVVSGSSVLYAPPENGNLTYLDPITYESATIPVKAGDIYEFFVDMDLFETKRNSYTGIGILEFFKSKILAGYATEENVDKKIQQAIKNGNFASKLDLVNYRHISQKVPAVEVDYSNAKLEDKSGTVQGALDEAVDYVTTAIPTVQTEVDELNEKISRIPKLSIEVVDTLPTENISDSTLYLVGGVSNAIPTSVDAESNIYNEIGYKQNAKWNDALGEDIAADGIDITGYIPVMPGDVISLKNISIDKSDTVNPCVLFFANEAYYSAYRLYAPSDLVGLASVWENNTLVSFKVPQTTTPITYLRIQATEISESSVVSINQEEGNLYTEYIYVNGVWERLGSQTFDLTGYTKTEDVPTKTSELENDSGFITKEDLPGSGTVFVEISSDSSNGYVYANGETYELIEEYINSGKSVVLFWEVSNTQKRYYSFVSQRLMSGKKALVFSQVLDVSAEAFALVEDGTISRNFIATYATASALNAVKAIADANAAAIEEMNKQTNIEIFEQSGGYWSIRGVWDSADKVTSKFTDIITVTEGEKYQYTGYGAYQGASILWFSDVAGSSLASYEIYNDGAAEGNARTVIVTVPTGVKSARFCSYSYTTPVLSVSVYEEELQTSTLAGKKIIYDGDSICESRTSAAANGGAYAKIIADITNSTYVNEAVGGARLTTRTDSGHSIVDNLVNLPVNGDLYCFEGGINDYWNGSSVKLGTYDKADFTGELDKATVCGALETIFRYALNNFIGKPICFVITHKIQSTAYATNEEGKTFEDYHDSMVGICQKYSIPYYDAFSESGLNGWNTAQNNAYLNANSEGTPDGCHPNEEGYKRYYVPQLISLFERIMPKK